MQESVWREVAAGGRGGGGRVHAQGYVQREAGIGKCGSA